MDNQKFISKLKEKSKLWYEYNYSKIPIILSGFQVFFSTAFLDFGFGDFNLKSHMSILLNLVDSKSNNMAAFWLFLAIMSSLVMLFNVFSYSKTKSTSSTLISTVLTIVQVVSSYIYINTFLEEMKIRSTLKFDSAMQLAFITLILSGIFAIMSTVFSWIYRDKNYVKTKE